MTKEELQQIIKEDDLGILSTKTKDQNLSADERLVQSFEEILEYVKKNDRLPQMNDDYAERRLAVRLEGIRNDPIKKSALIQFDYLNVLNADEKSIESLEDIFADDDLGILGDTDESIFELKHVSARQTLTPPEEVAKRKKCKNFLEYEPLFVQCHKDLEMGDRAFVEFTSDSQIQEGRFFVLNGVLLYIDKIKDLKKDPYGKLDGRQRCIFENGTESEMLFRSLVKRLYEGGKAVSEILYKENELLAKDFSVIKNEDELGGYLYIAKSLSTNPLIQEKDNLYKIGFSKKSPTIRIQNAETDPTFLMAPARLVREYQCYNINPQKAEKIIHSFLSGAQLRMDITSDKGERISPREWFLVDLDIAVQVIKLMIDETILDYRYDTEMGRIVKI